MPKISQTLTPHPHKGRGFLHIPMQLPIKPDPHRQNRPGTKIRKHPVSHIYSYNISHTYITYTIVHTLHHREKQLALLYIHSPSLPYTPPSRKLCSPYTERALSSHTGEYPSVQACRCAHTQPRGGVRTGRGMAILSILSIIPTLSIISISITQATFICYIKGDKVMCYIERKSPRPRSPRMAWHTNGTPVRAGPYNLTYGTRPVYTIAYKGTDR